MLTIKVTCLLYNFFTGLLVSKGPMWFHQRKFCLQQLRRFGYGKNSMEGAILHEALELADLLVKLGKEKGEAGVPMEKRFGAPTLNCLWMMIAGARFPEGDPKFVRMERATRNVQDVVHQSALGLAVIPPIRYVAPNASGYNYIINMANQIWPCFRVSHIFTNIFFSLNHYNNIIFILVVLSHLVVIYSM